LPFRRINFAKIYCTRARAAPIDAIGSAGQIVPWRALALSWPRPVRVAKIASGKAEKNPMGIDYRKEFADFGDIAYLNTSYHSPLPLAAVQAAQTALECKTRPYLLPDMAHFDPPDRAREKLARLIGADADEIAINTGASGGLAAVAAGIDWQPGDEVLIARGEFPAHFATWLSYERAGKLKMRIFTPRARFVTAADYIENIGPRTRVVSASFVRFDDGARLDSAPVGTACRRAGAALVLDLSQAAPAIPISIRELGADFAVCSGYKWLLGPYGVGFFWVRRESTELLKTGPIYYLSLEGAKNFHSLPLDNLRPVPGARRWDSAETASFTNLAALNASLDLLLRVGVTALAQHNQELISQLIADLPKGFSLASPAETDRRGPYVCIAAQSPEDTAHCYEKLRAAQVFVSFREGALRVSPYLFNTPVHISRLLEVLAA
jgi:selenocysteine lyase/cysteine desulfurase